MKITPSVSNRQFTAGKAYEVRRDPALNNSPYVLSDLGHQRIISLPVGGKCPHLRPVVKMGEWMTLRDWFAIDQQAGHWVEVETQPKTCPKCNRDVVNLYGDKQQCYDCHNGSPSPLF
jgi:hypothetical protein